MKNSWTLVLEEQFESLTPTEYKIKETQICYGSTKEYYGPGSYNKWIRVGWALANTHPKMLLTWLKFSSQDGCRQHYLVQMESLIGRRELFEEWKSLSL